jgi:caffeoyl-CoA O-methyltransferase
MSLIAPEIEQYCIEHSSKNSELSHELMEYTRGHVHGSNMLIGQMEASILTFLIKLAQVKTIVELGTYTGYSALIMAEALPEEGKLITIDLNSQTTAIAQSYWARSPHGKKITALTRPGLEALKDLSGKYDLIFIDADKNNYLNYLKWAIEHLSERGLIVTDNTLWSGKVLTPGLDKQTDSIREHNDYAASLEGFTTTLLPIRDGMLLLQRG